MTDNQYLQHYGIPKMKWGVRRFQNEDGSLTEEGKIRYGRSRTGRRKLFSKQKTAESGTPSAPKKELTNEEIVKSGRADVVLQNAGKLSTQELQAANARIRELENLRNVSMREIKKANDTLIKKGAKFIGKAMADEFASSMTKAAKGVTVYGIKKTIQTTFPEGELKGVLISSLSNKEQKKGGQ